MNFKTLTYRFFIIIVSFYLFACGNEANEQNDTKKLKTEKDTCIGKVSMHRKKTKLKFADLQEKIDTTLVFAKNGYKILPEQSQLEWFCDKHTGIVLLKEGELQTENGKLSGGSFIIEMDSIYDIDIENNLMRGTLENILRSEDFFDVKKYPQSEFNITEINNEQGNIFHIKGNLKIKSIEKPVAFKCIINISGDTLLAQTEKFIINRTDWGIIHMSKSHQKSENEFVFTDSLQFIINLKAVKLDN